MAKEKTRSQAYWHSAEGRRELFERTLNVLKVGGYRAQFSRPDPELFHRRMNQIAALGRKAG